jgi:hypothetical protein
MVCPCFVTDEIGFCGEADSMYIPSIAETELFCFTHKFASCALFEKSKLGTIKRYTKPVGDLFISMRRYR